MHWRFVIAAFVMGLAAAAGFAGETAGTFSRYDQSKKVLTIRVHDKETEFTINDSVKVTTPKGESAKDGIKIFSSSRTAKAGAPLTVVTATKDGKEVVVEIRLGRKKGS